MFVLYFFISFIINRHYISVNFSDFDDIELFPKSKCGLSRVPQ